MVIWGLNTDPIAVPHAAAIISEESLLDRIQAALGSPAEPQSAECQWTIHAAPPLPHSVNERFGSRMASVVPVIFKNTKASAASWIESLDGGWLFALPNGPLAGWLLVVGGPAESLLGASRMIADQILSYGQPAGEFPAYPRIATPLCGPRWLACGTAALAFDPLCGDGTATAIREAILASAVVRAAAEGAPVERLLAHYQTRLTGGMRRHLAIAAEYYRTGGRGPWWESELASLQRGIRWCDDHLAGAGTFRYRLNGFVLQPLMS
jgi:hypothetical protein